MQKQRSTLKAFSPSARLAEWVCRQNIAKYNALLAHETDRPRRAKLSVLLLEEQHTLERILLSRELDEIFTSSPKIQRAAKNAVS